MPSSKATFSLVPTPSALETSTGCGNFSRSSANRPPKPPISRQHMLVEGLARQHLDALLAPVADGDVDAGIGVAHRARLLARLGILRGSAIGGSGGGCSGCRSIRDRIVRSRIRNRGRFVGVRGGWDRGGFVRQESATFPIYPCSSMRLSRNFKSSRASRGKHANTGRIHIVFFSMARERPACLSNRAH